MRVKVVETEPQKTEYDTKLLMYIDPVAEYCQIIYEVGINRYGDVLEMKLGGTHDWARNTIKKIFDKFPPQQGQTVLIEFNEHIYGVFLANALDAISPNGNAIIWCENRGSDLFIEQVVNAWVEAK